MKQESLVKRSSKCRHILSQIPFAKSVLHYHYSTIDSTNGYAKKRAEHWEKGRITLLSADEQTKGYGRLGRSWYAPIGNSLSCSYIYVLPQNANQSYPMGNVAQIAALAAAKAIEDLCAITLQLKWPNDLLIEELKLGGILVETVVRSDGWLCLVIGIGLNVNATAEQLSNVGQPAISLFCATGQQQCRKNLLAKLTARLLHYLDRLFWKNGFEELKQEYVQHCKHRQGDPLTLHTSRGNYHGTFAGINHDGALCLLLPNGTTEVFYSGDLGPAFN